LAYPKTDFDMVDIRQSIRYSTYLKSIDWTVERIDNTNYFIKRFPILGGVLKVQRPEKLDFNTINKLCRKYRIFQVVIEPKLGSGSVAFHGLLPRKGYKLSKGPFLPTKTLQIDLSQSQKTIFNHFKKDARAAVKRGLVNPIKPYSTPDEIKRWHDAWRKSVKITRFVTSIKQLLNLRKSFSDNHSIFLASHNISGSIIGGALFTRSSHDVAYYWYGFTNVEGRTSLSQYPLLYQGILWAKRMGCKIFDFEGVYDPRFPNKSWLGFTHFKKSFGGYEVLYPGCYTKFRLPI
jgi:hypothetical protein